MQQPPRLQIEQSQKGPQGMNRRLFIATATATAASLMRNTDLSAALDVDIAESPIMWMLRMLPDREGSNSENFPPTIGMNHLIQREVWPENPDMYWDPIGEDYLQLFGYHPNLASLGAAYEQTSLTTFDNTTYSDDHTIETLEGNGWKIVDDTIRLMHYAGSDDDRQKLADSLNEMGPAVRTGSWDWISFPDVANLISGPDESLVRPIADRVKNFTAMSTIDSNFHGLRNILHPEAYFLSLLPPQVLPVENSRATYISKSWLGDVPIVQSIGMRLESPDLIEPTRENIEARMTSEISSSTDTPYADFLEIVGVESYYSSVRIDFVDSSGRWNIVQAPDQDDLKMLPPA